MYSGGWMGIRTVGCLGHKGTRKVQNQNKTKLGKREMGKENQKGDEGGRERTLRILL